MELHVLVKDRQTGAGLSRVKVTFYNFQEAAALRMMEVEKTHRLLDKNKAPQGVVTFTDEQGKATLTCLFEASFPLQEGNARYAEASLRPSGILAVEKEGFLPQRKDVTGSFPANASLQEIAASTVMFELARGAQ